MGLRSAAYFEQDASRRREGNRLPQRDVNQPPKPRARSRRADEEQEPERQRPQWFQHDDRDRQEPGSGRQGDRQGGRGPRSSREDGEDGQPRGSRSEESWEYQDPKGDIQGPFTPQKLYGWAEQGFFPTNLKVRTVGSTRFVPLHSVMPRLEQLVGLTAADGPHKNWQQVLASKGSPAQGGTSGTGDRRRERPREQQLYNPGLARRQSDEASFGSRGGQPARGGPGRGAGAPRGSATVTGGNDGIRERDTPPRGRAGSPGGRGGDRPARRPTREGHPAAALMSPGEREARGQRDREPRGPREQETWGQRDGAPARDRDDDRGGRGRGRGGGRGEQQSGRGQTAGGRGRGDKSKAANNLPYPLDIARKLFQAEAELASNHPVWWYIDPSGTVQGPFPANNMITWYQEGYLHDLSLPICGTERKVAPPNTPVVQQYVPLKQLFESVKGGQRFRPITIQEIAHFREEGATSITATGKPDAARAQAEGKQEARAQSSAPRSSSKASPRGKSWASATSGPDPVPTKTSEGTQGPGDTDPAVKALVANVFASVTGAVAEVPASTASSAVTAAPAGNSEEAAGEEPQEELEEEVQKVEEKEAGVDEAEGDSAKPEEPSEGAAPPEGGEEVGPGGDAAEEKGGDLQEPEAAEKGSVRPEEVTEEAEEAGGATEQTPSSEVKSNTSLLGGLLGGFFGRKKPSEKPAEKLVEKAVDQPKAADQPAEQPQEPQVDEKAAGHAGRLARDSPYAGGLEGSSPPGPGAPSSVDAGPGGGKEAGATGGGLPAPDDDVEEACELTDVARFAAVPEEQISFSASLLGEPRDTPPHSALTNAAEEAESHGPEASTAAAEGLDASTAPLDGDGEDSRAHESSLEEPVGEARAPARPSEQQASGGEGAGETSEGGPEGAEASGSPARGRSGGQGRGSGLVKAAVALFEKKEEGSGGTSLGSRGSGSLGPVPRGGAASLDSSLPSAAGPTALDGAEDAGVEDKAGGVEAGSAGNDDKGPITALPGKDGGSDDLGQGGDPAVRTLVAGVFQRLLSTSFERLV